MPPREVPHPFPFTPFAERDLTGSIDDRFARQVRDAGDRVAIQADVESVTFNELNAAADAVGARIVARGIAGPEPAGLLLDRGIDFAAAAFGVLRTGKFYLVLDVTAPDEHLRYVIADARVRMVLTSPENLARARDLVGEAGQAFDVRALPVPAAPIRYTRPTADDLAVVIYTSGSTGRPKGVMHTHGTVLADTRNVTNELGIGPSDRLVWHTSAAFAGSARTLFLALLNGAALYPFDTKRNGFGGLAEWLRANRITLFRTVPTTYRAFMASLSDDSVFPDVRIVSMGGEPLFPTDVRSFNRHFPAGAVLVHPFGPTECMVVCWHVVRQGEEPDGSKVPIGRPLQGVDVLLLDEHRRPVEPGAIGEIVVGSPGLSPGYLHDDERTSAAFIADPGGSGRRVYLTGDLGRQSPDGDLEHMGRRDSQIKVRGFRVEVAEIETALLGLDGIHEAAVVGQPAAAGDMRLVAYYVADPSAPIDDATIRQHLSRTLPAYMVPTHILALDALPRTMTGKTDRSRMPAVEHTTPHEADASTRPTNSVEQALVELWADTLGVEHVGIHSDFFALGGDSLRALTLLGRIERRLDTSLSLADLARCPTVAAQAADIARRAAPPSGFELVQVRAPQSDDERRRPPLVLAPALFGHVGEWRTFFDGTRFDREILGLELRGAEPFATSRPRIEHIAAEAVDLVARTLTARRFHLAGHSFGAHLAYELGRQLRARSCAPLSILLVDSSPHDADTAFGARDLLSMAANTPRWLLNTWRHYGLRDTWQRFSRRFAVPSALTAASLDRDLANEDPRSLRTVMLAFDWPTLPTLYRKRLAQAYSAVAAYQHQPTLNRLVVLRCRIKRFVHRHRPDGGWERYAPAGSLKVFTIPGDHGSALRPVWKHDVAAVIQQALRSGE